jgi:hypothetical protein
MAPKGAGFGLRAGAGGEGQAGAQNSVSWIRYPSPLNSPM